jgi:hypothetical protein
VKSLLVRRFRVCSLAVIRSRMAWLFWTETTAEVTHHLASYFRIWETTAEVTHHLASYFRIWETTAEVTHHLASYFRLTIPFTRFMSDLHPVGSVPPPRPAPQVREDTQREPAQ